VAALLLLIGCGTPAPAPAAASASPVIASASPVIASATAAPEPETLGAAVTFRETGLPPRSGVNVVATADGFANYGCANASGRLTMPSLPVTGQVSALSHLRADDAGDLTGTLKLPPPPPAGIECRPDERRLVTSARYNHIEVSDVTNRVRAAVGGEVAAP
jgi:hypothetical protein